MMAENLSKGALRVGTNSPAELNRVLSEVQNRIDDSAGLRGRAEVFDRIGVSQAKTSGDALNLGGFNAPTSPLPFRFEDADGNLLHSFGTTV